MSDHQSDTTEAPYILAARETLEAFVYRARRVEAHSLMRDVQTPGAQQTNLLKWANGTFVMTTGAAGDPVATITWDLPPEELFESLAARCRPFILDNETVFHSNVMKALGALTRGNDKIANAIKGLRGDWQRVTQRKDFVGFYTRVGEVGGPLGEPIHDVQSARSWLYGDLVHADATTTGETITDRYIAAVPIYLRVAILSLSTLKLIRKLGEVGVISLDPWPNDATVSVEIPVVRRGRFTTAPVGTAPEEVEAALDNLRVDQPLRPDDGDQTAD